MELNWSYLVFLSLLLIVEALDIKTILSAIAIMKKTRTPLNATPDEKSELAWLLVQTLIYTAAIVGAVACIVFFVLRHL